jgi:hypothetical protein
MGDLCDEGSVVPQHYGMPNNLVSSYYDGLPTASRLATFPHVSDRARQILLDAFWDAGGWRNGPAIAPDEFEIAKAAGYMFDPGISTHNDAVTKAINAADLIDPRDVAHAFVASLTSRRLEYRSAVGSFSFARFLPHHEAEEYRGYLCGVCGEPIKDQHVDWNIQNFVRIKWGGMGHGVPSYMAFDLRLFNELPEMIPTSADWEVLQSILTIAATQDPKARPDHLERAIGKTVRSNRHERRVLLQILGFAGILKPRIVIPIFDRFVPFTERGTETELAYPFSAWRGVDGVDHDAVRFWFPEIV